MEHVSGKASKIFLKDQLSVSDDDYAVKLRCISCGLWCVDGDLNELLHDLSIDADVFQRSGGPAIVACDRLAIGVASGRFTTRVKIAVVGVGHEIVRETAIEE